MSFSIAQAVDIFQDYFDPERNYDEVPPQNYIEAVHYAFLNDGNRRYIVHFGVAFRETYLTPSEEREINAADFFGFTETPVSDTHKAIIDEFILLLDNTREMLVTFSTGPVGNRAPPVVTDFIPPTPEQIEEGRRLPLPTPQAIEYDTFYVKKKTKIKSSVNGCSVCFEDVNREERFVTLRCGHLLHTPCFINLREAGHERCPLCLQEFGDHRVCRSCEIMRARNNFHGLDVCHNCMSLL